MKNRAASSAPLRLVGGARIYDRERRSVPASTDDARAHPARVHSSTPPLLDEPSLFYDPPYETSLHDEFAWHLVKYLKPGSGLRYRVDGPPLADLELTLDFLVEYGPLRVGFMCGASADGVEVDRLLDAVRMRHMGVDVLYRLRAGDVERHLHDALLLAAKWDAALFSERGRINLNTLATPEARAARPRPIDTVVTLQYEGEAAGPSGPTASLRIQRLSQAHPDGWMAAYERARAHFNMPPDSPAQRWARSA